MKLRPDGGFMLDGLEKIGQNRRRERVEVCL